MKFLPLVCAASLLLPGSAAVAKSGAEAKAKVRTHMVNKRVHAVRPAKPAKPKDPYAAYWNDPSRNEFPSWGYRGGF